MSTTSTVKRGGSARKRPTVKAKSRRTNPKTVSIWNQAVTASPFSHAGIDRAITIAMVTMISAALIAVAVFAGVPTFIGTQLAQIAGRAGFSVRRVEVNGINRMERLTVYAVALDQHSMAMPLVNLEKVRDQLMSYSWIKDARVYRRLPDTLVVDIVERKPAAVWQHNQTLSLVDETGWVLEPVALGAMPALPLLIGAQANMHSEQLKSLIGMAPALEPMIASATWVGSRRWDLRFQSGETLALPEGEAAAARALAKFARIDAVQKLLGAQYSRFDMRDPTKFVARIRVSQPTINASAQSNGISKEGKTDGPA